MAGCKNSTASGCRCIEHHPGLSAHAADQAAYDQALEACRPKRLTVVTFTPPHETPPCDGTMTCTCSDCIKQRAIRLNIPRPKIRQPWEPKAA